MPRCVEQDLQCHAVLVGTRLRSLCRDLELHRESWLNLTWSATGSESRRSTENSVLVVPLFTNEEKKLLEVIAREHSRIPIVAFVPELSFSVVKEAIRLGACTAVGVDDPTSELAVTIFEASRGYARFPVWLVHKDEAARSLSEQDIVWLRLLENESLTMTEIARRSAWSRAELYRRLRPTFRALGVSTRREAVLRARDLGYL